MRQFRKTFTDGLALPAEQRRPAGYLRGQHAVGQTRFAHLLAEAVLVMTSAGGGEILMCAATFEAVADAYPGRRTPTPSAQGRGVHGPEFPDPYRVTRGLT